MNDSIKKTYPAGDRPEVSAVSQVSAYGGDNGDWIAEDVGEAQEKAL